MNHDQEKSPLKFRKLHPDAVIPGRAYEGDIEYDLIAIDNGVPHLVPIYGSTDAWRLLYIEYRTGLAVEPPVGYHTEIMGRSSISKTDLILANCVGIVGNGYRGDLILRFKIPYMATEMFLGPTEKNAMGVCSMQLDSYDVKRYRKGDKMAHLLVRKSVIFPVEEERELSDTERGAGAFGSSGT